ncbi:MAG TPA: ribosome maturation factor RimM [Sandaracinaceae bacterium LLY-WYZ-13_1]|nr:ribosome maturation factor RimM [Sandaracinaceae bacterium LLY-WYZ-13_1]
MTSAERLVPLGAVTRPHGVRGEVRVHRFNPDSTLLLERDTVWLRTDDAPARPMRIERARLHGELILLTFEGVRGREAAEALRGQQVCVPRAELPEPDEDEHYHVDLIGLAAVDPDGRALGEVADVLRYPSVDCLAVDADDGRREVPFVEPYVVEVDLEAERVVIAHLEDLDVIRPRRRRGSSR